MSKQNAHNEQINALRARIEMELNRKNWSISELGRRVGLTPSSMRDLLHRGSTKASTLQRVAKELGVPMEVLLTEVGAEEYGDAMLPRRRSTEA